MWNVKMHLQIVFYNVPVDCEAAGVAIMPRYSGTPGLSLRLTQQMQRCHHVLSV